MSGGDDKRSPCADSATRRPVLLDLFCGAGGAAMGYHRAGFDVLGVDLGPQPDYPFRFVQADALEVLATLDYDAVDAIHASPPCQGYVQWNNLNAERYGTRVEHPLLIGPVRGHLEAIGVPYVIENVPGAPLRTSLMLCGSMFGLDVRRHRLFESNVLMMGPPSCAHTGNEVAIYGKLDGRRIWTRTNGSEVRAARTLEQASAAMGIDWMAWDELKEAIPPAYTEWIGRALRAHIDADLDYWDRCGVITPSISPRRGSGTVGRYSQADLVRLRVARILFDGGMKADRVRQALNTLTQAEDDGQHAEYLIVADTYTAVASDQTALVEHLAADTQALTIVRVPFFVAT